MKRLGKYVDLEEIGRGQSATVYRGLHPELKIMRALKVFSSQDASSEARLREAVYQARLDHPGIVSMIDLERDPKSGALYLVMEYAPMGTLRERVGLGALEPEMACQIAAQVADALAAAHAREVWHLDLKPDNILFFGPDLVKIGDFGLARTPGEARDPAWLMGTPNYMAPEQLAGSPGAASDLWALGAIFFEMLTGRPCFPGKDFGQISMAIEKGPGDLAARFRQAGVAVSLGLTDLIARLLADRPEERPASAQETAQLIKAAMPSGPQKMETLELGSFCNLCGAPVPVGNELCPDCLAPDGLPAASPPPKPPPILGQEAHNRRKPLIIGTVAGVVLLVFVALGFSPDPPWKSGTAGTKAAPVPTLTAFVAEGSKAAPKLPSPAPRSEAKDKTKVAATGSLTAPAKPAEPAPAAKPEKTAAKPAKPAKAETAKIAKAPAAPAVKPKPRPRKAPVVFEEEEVAPPPVRVVRPVKVVKPITVWKPVRPNPGLDLSESDWRPAPRPSAKTSTAKTAKEVSRGEIWRAMSRNGAGSNPGRVLSKAARTRPGHLGSRRNLALWHLERGNYRAALKQLRYILKRKPGDLEAKSMIDFIKTLQRRSGG